MIEAWISDEEKVISFHKIEEGDIFREQDDNFWGYVLELVNMGYRLQ